MSTEARRDLKLSGSMTMPGGLYKRVSVSGSVVFDGDVDCLEYKVSGGSTVNGRLKSENIVVSGSTTFEKDVEGGEIRISGSTDVEGSLTARKVKTSGSLKINGNLAVESADITGELKTRGNCDAETFSSSGAISIEGTLNAEVVAINLFSLSQVKEIVGGQIIVERTRGNRLAKLVANILDPLEIHRTRLVVDTIEGDEVVIEHTRAKIVRGKAVRIGEGCEIDLVEYQETLDRSDKSSVLKQVKV